MKGLPLTYGKDMQEDKEPLFDAADTLALALAAMAGMVRDLKAEPGAHARGGRGRLLHRDRPRRLAGARAGLPFREAHHVTGALVAMADDKGVDLAELTLAEMQAVEPRITRGVYRVLTVEASVAARTCSGGTAPANVRAAAKAARKAGVGRRLILLVRAGCRWRACGKKGTLLPSRPTTAVACTADLPAPVTLACGSPAPGRGRRRRSASRTPSARRSTSIRGRRELADAIAAA